VQIIFFKFQGMAGRATCQVPWKKGKLINGTSLDFCILDVRFESGVGNHTQLKNIAVGIFSNLKRECQEYIVSNAEGFPTFQKIFCLSSG
jgi:hypothetical protein